MTPPTPVLTGDGFTLRAYRPSDVDGIVAYRNDPLTQANVGSRKPYTRERALWFVTHVTPVRDDQIMWVIDVDGAYAGSVELTTFGRGFSYGAAKLGYGTHPDHRGRGLARRAAALAVEHVWSLGVTTVVWQALTGNDASWRVARSLGFSSFVDVPGLLALPSGLADGRHAVLSVHAPPAHGAPTG